MFGELLFFFTSLKIAISYKEINALRRLSYPMKGFIPMLVCYRGFLLETADDFLIWIGLLGLPNPLKISSPKACYQGIC